VIDTAFVVAHVMVEVCPAFTSVGLALKVVICGTIFGGGGVVVVVVVLLPPHPRSWLRMSSERAKEKVRQRM
jgi:hypothetical protein